MSEYLYQIRPNEPYKADLMRTLTPWTYLTQEKAVNALKNACEKNGWKLNPEPETTEDNSLVFKNAKDGVEIARVVPVDGPRWRWCGLGLGKQSEARDALDHLRKLDPSMADKSADVLSSTPVVRINQAFLQLEFAVKLMCYVELRKLDKRTFDTDTLVLLEDGSLNFPDNSFNTYDDLILAAQNNYQIALGFSAIALESGLQDAGLNNNPTDVSPEGQLRTLGYMIRNAFAHDMMIPRWRVDERYKRPLPPSNQTQSG